MSQHTQHTRHLSSSVPNSRNPSFLSQSPATDPYERPVTASSYSASRSANSTPSTSSGNATMHRHAGSVESESILPMSANNTISTITGSAPPRKPRPRSGSSAAAFYSPHSQSSMPVSSSASSQSPISPTSVPFPHPSTSQQMQANKSKNFLSRFNLGGLRSTSSTSATSLTSSSTSSSTTTSPTSSQTTVSFASPPPPSLALPANPREDSTLASGMSPHHRVKRKPVPQTLDLTLLNPSPNQPTSVTSPSNAANFTSTGRRASTISQNSLGSISTPNLSSFTSADLAPVHGLDSDTDDDDDEAREHKANALRRVTSDKTNQQKRVATSGSGNENGVPGLPAERSRKSSFSAGAVEGHVEEKKLGEDDPNHSNPHSPTSPSHRKHQNGVHSEPASQTSSMSSMDPPSPRQAPSSPTTANSGEPDEQEFLKHTLRDYATAYSHMLSDADQKRKNLGNTGNHARRQSDVTGSSRGVAAIAIEDRGNRRPLQHGNYVPSSPPLSSSSTNNSRTNPSSRMQHPNEIPQNSSKAEDDMRPRNSKRDTLQNHLDYFGMNLSAMTTTYLTSGVVDTPELRAGTTRPISTPPTISSPPVPLSKSTPPSSSSPTGRVPPPRSSSLNRGQPSSRTSVFEASGGSGMPSPRLAGVPSPADTSISSPVDTGVLRPENTGLPNLITTNLANKLVTSPTVVSVSSPTALEKVEEEQREVVVPNTKANPKSGVRSLVMAFEGGGTTKAGIHEKKQSVSGITRRVELRTPPSSELSISSKDNLSHIVTSPVDLGPSDRSKRSTKIFIKPSALPGMPTDDATSPPPGSPAFSDDDDQSSRRYRPSYASANTTSSYYSSAYETASMHSMADSFDELDTAPTSPVLDGFELSPPRASLRARSRENSDTPEIYVVGADPMHDDDGGITSESDDDDDEDDDVFVDATGDSQDDIERERVVEKLTKRLSGGHFGSAGGLILSTAPGALAGSIKHNSGQLEDLRALAERAMHFVDRGGEKNARGSVATVRGVLRESVATVRGHVRGTESGAGMLGVTADEEEDGGLSDATVMADERSEVKAKVEKGDEPDLEDQARDAARKCWMEDPSFVEKEKMAEFLGLKKPLNSQALTFYMEYFDFSDQRLDYAFRKLCQKLYFKAEAQQIDRILEVFANRYFECNPKSLYGSTDVVYAVVYSVLLLNTDLHVAQGSYTKMSRSAFVKNTMGVLRDQSEAFVDSDALDYEHTNSQTTSSTGTSSKQDRPEQTKEWEMDMEVMLKEIYTSVKTHQILQPLTSSSESRTSSQAQRSASPGPQPPASPTTSTSGLNRSRSLLNTGRVIKRGVGAAMRKNTKDSVIIPENELDAPRTSTSTSRPTTARRDSNSSVNSANSMASGVGTVTSTHGGTYRAISPTNNSHIAAMFSSSAPFYKEGLVVRKHLLERADQKAKHRDWKECFLIVDRGELRMYRLEGGPGEQGRRSMMSRHSTSSMANLSDSNVGISNSAVMVGVSLCRFFILFLDFVFRKIISPLLLSLTHPFIIQSSGQLIGDVNLRHTLANALPPPGYNRQRPHVFALQQPDGGVYLFQAASQAQVNEWVSTCNYWAARESKEPLAGGVSNMEYGWGGCLEPAQSGSTAWSDPDSVMIFEWKPPLPPMVSSPLDEMAQLAMLRRHTDELNKEMDSHKDYKRRIEAKFPRSANLTKALTNWENKSQYLLHEIIKYQNYCDAIEKGLALREQADQAEEESEGVGMQAAIMTASGESPSHSASNSNRNTIDGLLPKVSFGDASKGGQNRTTWAGPDFQV
ncbi:hypothetical protein BC937DRAFT_90927 [Endogone sp. FLAS-F59071]|nr:hypothetical protein BC937DRAFT_90927 [Endogone sp. FLAS-F59071]|eukprot:RUS21948.1 hypothetical protein BC937DRAFT_90927 [Endogone sp. FLAS-F59071]